MSQREAAAASLENLCVVFGKGRRMVEALKNITANIPAGQITGVMGPDAAGKTTFIRILAGLLLPASGHATVLGLPSSLVGAKKPNSIGYMPQRFGLYEDISVMANLELYASLRGVTGAEKDQLFKKLLGFTSLARFTDRLAGNLSGGMKQKLGIACALLGSPELLLLDEPGVGVDPRSRRELWEMVKELSSGGMSVVWSTSYMDEGAKCENLIILDEGNILFDGQPADLTKKAAGRVYLLPAGGGDASPGQAHRAALAYWTGRAGILDALIQGKYLRLVLAPDAPKDALAEIMAKGGKATPPRLEDAYMGETGGIDKRPSPYANIGKIVAGKPGEPVIVANGLTKKFGNFTAANKISFKVRPGEIVGLLGPNGAGKSTTFRMLCGLLRPTAGDCFVDGVDLLQSSSEARSHLGYMAQKFSLYQDISVKNNISISASLYGVPKKRRNQIVPILADALDLSGWMGSRSGDLPLGLKQRLSLLCATLHEAPALFLDEPTSGVDARARRDFWKHISALTAAGAAVLVTTHFMEEAEYCDYIALIYRGNMIRFGTPDELKASVKNIANPTMEDAFIANIEEYDEQHPL